MKNIHLITIHGNSSAPSIFKHQEKIGVSVKHICLPGHGELASDEQEEHNFTVEAMKKAILSQIGESEHPILLLGHSLGGHFAIEIAHEIPNLIGLIIFGTPPIKKPINMEEAFLPTPVLQTLMSEYPSDEDLKEAMAVATVNASIIPELIRDFKQTDPRVRRVLAQEAMEGKWSDQNELFTSLNVPKYIFLPDQDISVNPAYLRAIQAENSDSCSIISVADCGHYASVEQPEQFNEALKKVITELQ